MRLCALHMALPSPKDTGLVPTILSSAKRQHLLLKTCVLQHVTAFLFTDPRWPACTRTALAESKSSAQAEQTHAHGPTSCATQVHAARLYFVMTSSQADAMADLWQAGKDQEDDENECCSWAGG